MELKFRFTNSSASIPVLNISIAPVESANHRQQPGSAPYRGGMVINRTLQGSQIKAVNLPRVPDTTLLRIVIITSDQTVAPFAKHW